MQGSSQLSDKTWWRDAALYLFFCGCFVFPFFNFARYTPLQDWWTNAGVVLCVGIAGLFALRRGQSGVRVPLAAAALAALLLLLSFSNGLLLENYQPAILILASLAAMLVLAVFLVNRLRPDLARVCVILASCLLLGSCIQIVLGSIQLLDLARYCRGLVTLNYLNPTEVMGNVGQRNQYAQYLSWGVAAACYLYGRGRLRAGFCAPLVLFQLLLITWCGARLPLAYSLGICGLCWFWHRRAPGDEALLRMLKALAAAIIVLALLQLFNEEIVWLLNRLGLPIHVQSGSERLLDAGFGARRRIEWTKAWMVFQQHPWLGVGLARYPAQSVWLEAFGGLPKYPEGVLFTQSHNLIFQLLAETGLSGALVAGLGLCGCLLPFFARGRQSPENLLLICIAMMLLTHSMFEFPLWYLPFLAMLVTVCALGPAPVWQVPTRTMLLRLACAGGGALMIAHIVSGVFIFWNLVAYSRPSLSAAENIRRVNYIEKVERNPLWIDAASMVMGNYLLPGRRQLAVVLPFYEQLARNQPYIAVLQRLSVCQALAGQPEAARRTLVMAIASYPDEVLKLDASLQPWQEPEVRALAELTSRVKAIYLRHGAYTDAARMAAVTAVASPVTRKPLF
ncbi:PglL family O-oligosaccharyltransferase [Chromobacterium subtsugae]|uniref:PglL family O-oligosaccharyltransferase n=1 Tax=Chromobacterium subtsugae TaxID=251747 RepID=UPI0009C0A049|nr:Wzy polymerase domain-containing protein [Chromobacterium subtsugae]